MKQDRYPFLDGFRAVAIIAVLISHTYHLFKIDIYHPNTFLYVYAIIGPWGQFGVDIFFIISGFLITGVIVKGYARRIDATRFYFSRFLKIVPVFIFIFITASILGKIFHLYPYSNIRRYGNTLLFLFTDRVHLLFEPIWTLRVESYFYLYYPLIICIIFLLFKKPKDRRFFLLGFMIFVIIISISCRHLFPRIPVFQSFDGLAIGCILKIMEPYYSRIKVGKAFQGFLIGASILGIILVLMDCYFWAKFPEYKFSVASFDIHVGISIAIILFFFLSYFRVWIISWFVEHPFIRWMGKISYAFYLWHATMLYIFLNTTSLGPANFRLLLLWVTTTLVAAITTFTVEKYFLSFKRYIK